MHHIYSNLCVKLSLNKLSLLIVQVKWSFNRYEQLICTEHTHTHTNSLTHTNTNITTTKDIN